MKLETRVLVYYSDENNQNDGIPLLMAIKDRENQFKLVKLCEENNQNIVMNKLHDISKKDKIDCYFIVKYLEGVINSIDILNWIKFLEITKLFSNSLQWIEDSILE